MSQELLIASMSWCPVFFGVRDSPSTSMHRAQVSWSPSARISPESSASTGSTRPPAKARKA